MSELKALVVEDSPTMRQMVVFALRRIPSLSCIEAEDGVDALRKLQNDTVDIIVTDINMPMMDGLKLIGMVRKDARHKDVPIIVVTTEGAIEDRERGLALGADAYLVKPIDASAVVAKVEELLHL
jgi:two-component system chemotaxis response regulator CheY